MKISTIIILLIFLSFFNCTGNKTSTILDSDNYATLEERIKILQSEINYKSEFHNAEFELFNVNGFSNSRVTVPGASSLNYKFVIKVGASDVDKWTKGMIKTQSNNQDFDWTKEIIKNRKNDWQTESSPEFYNREKENVIMIVYRNEGIIFKRVIRK